jgi:hypothetical protein
LKSGEPHKRNPWATYEDWKLSMERNKINIRNFIELTEGEVTSVGSEELFLHDVQKVNFPLDENMRTGTNFGHQLIALFLVHCGTLEQRLIFGIVHLLFSNTRKYSVQLL